jgi:phospholipid/cholesterol/gamma-HCH transport system permease protein
MPIIAFLSFFVGLVIAFIGATLLSDFGLEVFTVQLIGFAVLREFGVVLTGIVLAGRTNSSFTAQIGSMKMRQEIDAMQTLGLKAMDVIVAPRVLAMLVMTPVLTFVATISGIAGGMAVCWGTLDIPPAVFLEQMRAAVTLDQFWVGMSKSPVFGLVVALIACRQGLQVGGSVQSLGKATTTSVVQAIFAIIVIDALFAIFYMEMGI